MPRIGINPARGKVSNYKPADITIAILTYIPHLDGYFKHRLDILKLVLASLKAHTTLPHDKLVFDNGSCAEVVEYLLNQRDIGEIEYLILARDNIGKIGAFQLMFNFAPGKFIAYSDDDILYYPGWLEAHLEILNVFPNAGMVSGTPVRMGATYANKSLEKLIHESHPGVTISYERKIPEAWEIDWATSTGREPSSHLEAFADHKDIVLHSGGVEVIGSANHFQFIAPKDVIVDALPKTWSSKLMGSMVELDENVDANGYLRLSTSLRYTRHVGNAINAEIVEEASQYGITLEETTDASPSSKHWILQIPGARRIFKAVYNRLFRLLN